MTLQAPERASAHARFVPWLVRFRRTGRAEPELVFEQLDGGSDPLASSASAGSVRVLFRGRLQNRAELSELVGADDRAPAGDAGVVLRAYERWGQDSLRHLRGVFAAFIWDDARERLLCTRDPHGLEPLFYATSGDDLVFAPSPTILIGGAGVSDRLRRTGLAELIMRRWPVADETSYEAIRRVHVLHALEVTNGSARPVRYWHPLFDLRDHGWVAANELEAFDGLLEQAVSRCVEPGPAGVLLSGGLDSVSVAAISVNLAQRRGLETPMALSLLFPTPETDERDVQVGVAKQLGMNQAALDLLEAVGPAGVVSSALEMNATWPWPVMFLWAPAYRRLIELGARDGVQTVLSGDGGDEWLTVDRTAAADLIAGLELRALYEFVRAKRRSYVWPRWSAARILLWQHGLRPILRFHAVSTLERQAPTFLHALQAERHARRLDDDMPEWLLPDPELRAEVRERCIDALFEADREKRETQWGDSYRYYLSEGVYLDHALSSYDQEDAWERGKRVGVEYMHPYLDPDLVSFLFRVPPELLLQGGREKGLVRSTIARRFPDLGFERQKKVMATSFHYSALRRECPEAWRRLGGCEALVDLGIVRPDGLDAIVAESLASPRLRDVQAIWDLIKVEAWTRRFVSRPHAL